MGFYTDTDETTNMKARIDTIGEKRLVGKRMKMSLSDNRTGDLWHSFMLRRNEIKDFVGTDLYSMQVYEPLYFRNFNPNTQFEKWAAIEVANFDCVPDEMETITLASGLYAVFLHKGAANTAPKTFQHIFGTWLPNSEYDLDDRPHFEVLRDKFKNEDPNSEEEIWIPIKLKNNIGN